MRKYAAPLLAVLVAVSAFFLPEILCRREDDHILDQSHLIQQKEGEDFSQWSQFSVAEKLLLIRSGNVQRVSLPRDTVPETRYVLRSGRLEPVAQDFSANTADDPEAQALELWSQRIQQAYSELNTLQKAGAVPPIWSEGDVISLKRHSQSLYIDRETQVSFPVYSLELLGPPYDVYLTIDSQSGRIMGAAIAWAMTDFPKWEPMRLTFWKDYWHMDSLNPELLDTVLRDLRFPARDKEQTLTLEAVFTYDDQTLLVPITRRDYSSSCSALFWNYETPDIGGWQPAENLLGSADGLRPILNKGGH